MQRLHGETWSTSSETNYHIAWDLSHADPSLLLWQELQWASCTWSHTLHRTSWPLGIHWRPIDFEVPSRSCGESQGFFRIRPLHDGSQGPQWALGRNERFQRQDRTSQRCLEAENPLFSISAILWEIRRWGSRSAHQSIWPSVLGWRGQETRFGDNQKDKEKEYYPRCFTETAVRS